MILNKDLFYSSVGHKAERPRQNVVHEWIGIEGETVRAVEGFVRQHVHLELGAEVHWEPVQLP